MGERILIKSNTLLGFIKNYFIITDTKIIGRDFWGRYIEVPVDEIYITGTSILWGVFFKTSQGKIHFRFIKGNDAIPAVVSRFLIENRKRAQTLKT